jgi:hypothetical protein
MLATPFQPQWCLERFSGPGVTHLPAGGENESTGRKTALALMLADAACLLGNLLFCYRS